MRVELQMAGAKSPEISVASLLAELEEARSKATSLNQLSAAVRATAEKAKISGLLTQKVEVSVNQDTAYEDAISAEQVLFRFAEDFGPERARMFAACFNLEFDPNWRPSLDSAPVRAIGRQTLIASASSSPR